MIKCNYFKFTSFKMSSLAEELDLKNREPNYLNIAIAVILLLLIATTVTYFIVNKPAEETVDDSATIVQSDPELDSITFRNGALYLVYSDGISTPIPDMPESIDSAFPNASNSYVLYSVMDVEAGTRAWYVYDVNGDMRTQITGSTYMIDDSIGLTVTTAYQWISNSEILVADEVTTGGKSYLKYNAERDRLESLTEEEQARYAI